MLPRLPNSDPVSVKREETFSRCPDSFYFPYRSTFFLKSEITDAD